MSKNVEQSERAVASGGSGDSGPETSPSMPVGLPEPEKASHTASHPAPASSARVSPVPAAEMEQREAEYCNCGNGGCEVCYPPHLQAEAVGVPERSGEDERLADRLEAEATVGGSSWNDAVAALLIEAAAALRTRSAPQQEPVAWMVEKNHGSEGRLKGWHPIEHLCVDEADAESMAAFHNCNGNVSDRARVVPLYRALSSRETER